MSDRPKMPRIPWIALLAKKIYQIVYTIYKARMSGVWLRKEARIVLWIPSLTPTIYFRGGLFIKDLALIKSLKERSLPFTVHVGLKIGKYNNCVIFYHLSDRYNVYSFNNHMSAWEYISEQLEKQRNLVFYTSREIKYWENKIYMYDKFAEYGIPHPRTRIIEEITDLQDKDVSFPLLVKDMHSRGSQGIFKINDLNELKELIESPAAKQKNNGKFIVQELLNMRRDLRVIVVGEEIVLHYWRINKTDAWLPTSTGFGSEVDFDDFPEAWRNHIVTTFKKLGITTGAFDIAWQNDDLSLPPLYLEVSPSYQPNPKPLQKVEYYGLWKKSFSMVNNYDKAYIDLVFEIEDKYLEECLKLVKQKTNFDL